MKIAKTELLSWVIVIWICKVFLFSLPYKFTLHPDTQHIFGIIGGWLKSFLGDTIGTWFANYGSYVVGSFELLTSLVLLLPALLFVLYKVGVMAVLPAQNLFHGIGGAMAFVVMSGAVFFHLVSPLGVEVIHEGQSDGGSLFYAAVSIMILGLLMALINIKKYLKTLG